LLLKEISWFCLLLRATGFISSINRSARFVAALSSSSVPLRADGAKNENAQTIPRKRKGMSQELAWQEVSSDKLCQRDGDGFRQKKSFGVRE
jgi:hypothetical protein